MKGPSGNPPFCLGKNLGKSLTNRELGVFWGSYIRNSSHYINESFVHMSHFWYKKPAYLRNEVGLLRPRDDKAAIEACQNVHRGSITSGFTFHLDA